ncbi:efflux RND transporter periplasmic adaptor subunit [Congregibacter variabilis]|uniref:Efflux RND transporter periplasmic adaptor subunit n=1 Tax=Congregibacter variabilis TaxID=3081200 RepID=A0ABZ0I1D6_9GAMM|nr:efflux RND transporter periplasmic adaptor subunit [Congregibacter sp. IMCC43200]
MKLRQMLIIPVIVTASAAALSNTPGATVHTASVTREATAPTAELPGTVISTRDAQVRAELSGRITWIAEVGDRVKAGEPIARFDDHLLTLQLRRDEAQIARLRTDIDVRTRQRERLARLAMENNMAEVELDQVKADIEMLRQDLAMAEVDRERAAYELERSRMPAPFSGVVVARNMSEGEYSTAGSPLVRLVNTQSLEVSVRAPLRIARFNQTGTPVSIYGDGAHTVEEIRSVVPVGDPQSRMMEMRISLEEGLWLIGEAVTVSLPQAAPSDMLTVPRDALVLRDREQFVYAVDSDNTARKVLVETAGGLGERIAVEPVDGLLKPGTNVIVRGAENLREGQDVRIIDDPLA